MELEFGHGFIPRIGKNNYKAVDRCIGPTDLFTTLTLDLPWAIVDGAWAEGKPELLDTLKANETKLLVDTFGWCYRYEATREINKLILASWAPAGPVNLTDKRRCRELILDSLRAQAALGAGAYLLPGWMPEDGSEDLRPAYDLAFQVAAEADDIPAIDFSAATFSNGPASTRSGHASKKHSSSTRSHPACGSHSCTGPTGHNVPSLPRSTAPSTNRDSILWTSDQPTTTWRGYQERLQEGQQPDLSHYP
ncbi:MAG: hypothetical protein F4X48_04000 [Acidimicrobiia bacterium]|nr:hypothetical protein [Acidimicrobiia bacterium]MYC57736.1 hypothetical protein [Acidimicrobiia bacterium]MYI29749.1 hypothetical protein [Acidimicrobiia bacterium]